MSSGESAGQQPIKPKRILRPLSSEQWNLARIQFETGDSGITLARIAAIFNTSRSSVEKRCAAEKWTKGLSIVKDARKQLQVATGNAMAQAADKAAQEVALRLTKELQPWIEKEKRAHIQRAVRRSKRALKRLDGIADGYDIEHPKTGGIIHIPLGPKDEMLMATSEDKYDGIIRRNLGMNDSTGLSGALSVRVLTEGAAIEVQSS